MARSAEALAFAGLALLFAGAGVVAMVGGDPAPPLPPAGATGAAAHAADGALGGGAAGGGTADSGAAGSGAAAALIEPTDQPGLHAFVAACAAADATAIPRLRDLARSADPATAANAVRALGRLRALDGRELAACLGDDRPRVRQEAVVAAGAMADPEAARRLEPLLRDPDRQVRLLAVQALARLGATAALAALCADPATDAETRAFAQAAVRPVQVPRLLASTGGTGR